MYDRVTDRSRGFAFVMMGSVEDAKEAIRMFDGAVSLPPCIDYRTEFCILFTHSKGLLF